MEAKIALPLFFISPEKGAATSIFVADDPSVVNLTGQYFTKSKVEKLTPVGINEANRAALRAFTEQSLGLGL
jgi:hypothetical protein